MTENKKLTLSIVLPTYNERKNIEILIPQIEEVFKEDEHEILIVDDDSSDGTAAAVMQLNDKFKNISLIKRLKKEGIGAALKEGYNQAKKEVILSSDADLSFSVKDMFRLYEKIQEGYDMVLGSRHCKGGGYRYKTLKIKIKSLISKFGNTVVRFLTGIDIHDFSANFRVVKRSLWDSINVVEKTNIILLEMILKAKTTGAKITEIPVFFEERVYGETKLNLWVEIPRFMTRMMKYILEYRRKLK